MVMQKQPGGNSRSLLESARRVSNPVQERHPAMSFVPRFTVSRRGVLLRAVGLAAAALPLRRGLLLAGPGGKHPDPRPGITSEGVLSDEHVPEKSKKAYAAARELPQILDGLYCHCDCADRDGLRSLLSCFETRMPFNCGLCRGEAELAHKLYLDGKSLDEIRAAIDKRYK